MTIVDQHDIIYLTTDGISDNFDPVVTKIAVASKEPEEGEERRRYYKCITCCLLVEEEGGRRYYHMLFVGLGKREGEGIICCLLFVSSGRGRDEVGIVGCAIRCIIHEYSLRGDEIQLHDCMIANQGSCDPVSVPDTRPSRRRCRTASRRCPPTSGTSTWARRWSGSSTSLSSSPSSLAQLRSCAAHCCNTCSNSRTPRGRWVLADSLSMTFIVI